MSQGSTRSRRGLALALLATPLAGCFSGFQPSLLTMHGVKKPIMLSTTDRIGGGGMGVVYRGVHTLLGRPAAIKVLQPEFSRNQEMVQRFFNEAKAASAIRHPGIVEIYTFGFHSEGSAYIAMAYLEGETLERRLRRTPVLPVPVAAVARNTSTPPIQVRSGRRSSLHQTTSARAPAASRSRSGRSSTSAGTIDAAAKTSAKLRPIPARFRTAWSRNIAAPAIVPSRLRASGSSGETWICMPPSS